MFNHGIVGGVLQRRGRGLIFIKGVRGFEAKKASNLELEALDHGCQKRKEEEEEEEEVERRLQLGGEIMRELEGILVF